jgi:hypothetical protein
MVGRETYTEFKSDANSKFLFHDDTNTPATIVIATEESDVSSLTEASGSSIEEGSQEQEPRSGEPLDLSEFLI